ncbi:MAG: hypothetical protein RIG82_08365 [Phycisphaeraceae bacterium]
MTEGKIDWNLELVIQSICDAERGHRLHDPSTQPYNNRDLYMRLQQSIEDGRVDFEGLSRAIPSYHVVLNGYAHRDPMVLLSKFGRLRRIARYLCGVESSNNRGMFPCVMWLSIWHEMAERGVLSERTLEELRRITEDIWLTPVEETESLAKLEYLVDEVREIIQEIRLPRSADLRCRTLVDFSQTFSAHQKTEPLLVEKIVREGLNYDYHLHVMSFLTNPVL